MTCVSIVLKELCLLRYMTGWRNSTNHYKQVTLYSWYWRVTLKWIVEAFSIRLASECVCFCSRSSKCSNRAAFLCYSISLQNGRQGWVPFCPERNVCHGQASRFSPELQLASLLTQGGETRTRRGEEAVNPVWSVPSTTSRIQIRRRK